MKIWMTGEIDKSVYERYRNIRAFLEKELNEFFINIDLDIELWFHACIILKNKNDNFSEVRTLHKRQKKYESRIFVDYEEFLSDETLAFNSVICSLTEVINDMPISEDKKNIITSAIESLGKLRLSDLTP